MEGLDDKIRVFAFNERKKQMTTGSVLPFSCKKLRSCTRLGGACIAVAIASLALGTLAAERTAAASGDSPAQTLDTRIGTVGAIESLALDSRTGSWAVSNLRGINTNPVGALFILR